MAAWKTTLEVLPKAVRLLVTDAKGNDLVKAHLPNDPGHPRALLTALEGLALWCGEPLSVVICADIPVSHSLGLGSFTDLDDGWPEETALVHFLWACDARRGRRIRGLGDFRRLRPRP
jgi:hypothetical protein